MGVPQIINVIPDEGPTAGRSLVEIYGREFRLPPDPTDPTDTGPIPKTVEVLFGGEPAKRVDVISPILLRVLPPKSPIQAFEANGYGAGDVDITIRNLDDNEDPIPGEEVTLADGYKYRRPKLDHASQSDLTRLVFNYVLEWRRQVLPNVLITQHTDFDSDTGDGLNIVDIAEKPAIVLTGPATPENRFYSVNHERDWERDQYGDAEMTRPPHTVDLLFDIVGISDSEVEMMNLMNAAIAFVERNPLIEMDRDPDDASKGRVEYEHDFQTGGEVQANQRPNDSNIIFFTGSVLIRGFDVEGFQGFELEDVVRKVQEAEEVDVDSFPLGE